MNCYYKMWTVAIKCSYLKSATCLLSLRELTPCPLWHHTNYSSGPGTWPLRPRTISQASAPPIFRSSLIQQVNQYTFLGEFELSIKGIIRIIIARFTTSWDGDKTSTASPNHEIGRVLLLPENRKVTQTAYYFNPCIWSTQKLEWQQSPYMIPGSNTPECYFVRSPNWQSYSQNKVNITSVEVCLMEVSQWRKKKEPEYHNSIGKK